MIIYTISADRGRFCDYHRRWYNFFRRLPEFRWDTMPHHGECVVFLDRNKAVEYLKDHGDLPSDCKIYESDLDSIPFPER